MDENGQQDKAMKAIGNFVSRLYIQCGINDHHLLIYPPNFRTVIRDTWELTGRSRKRGGDDGV